MYPIKGRHYHGMQSAKYINSTNEDHDDDSVWIISQPERESSIIIREMNFTPDSLMIK